MIKKSWQIEEYFEIKTSPLVPPLNKERLGEVIFVEKRKVALGEYGLFVIGFEWEIDKETSHDLKNLCKKENCLFVQVETLDYSIKTGLVSRPVLNGFKNTYYKKFIPPYTALINLEQTEEEIFTNMKPKGRYNIRLAEKKWVVVEQVDKHIWNIKKFFELMKETTSRDNFSGNTLEYYKIFLETIEESQLFFAYFEQKVIAAGIFVTSEDTMIYYYGASSSEYRNVMAPYLLQWKVIEHAKKRKLKFYDFLGVAGADETNSSLAGVTDFKMKLSEDRRFVSESYLWVNKKWKYKLIQLLRKLKKTS
jgi:lipid II:glycine glycyltransferase (peptidoglycan interpeptide bridge formation enzyme)